MDLLKGKKMEEVEEWRGGEGESGDTQNLEEWTEGAVVKGLY